MPPRRLPLYPTVPRAFIEYTTPHKPTPGACKRCALGETVKNVCAKSDGTGYKGPGAVWVLGGAPLASEDYAGSAPMGGEAGKFLRGILAGSAVDNVVWSFAVRCATAHGGSLKDKATVKAVEACRVFAAEDMRHIRPSRILAIGDVAARSIFGEDAPSTRTVRFAHGWLGPDARHVVPVFLLPDPTDALRFRTLRGQYVEDVKWALTYTPEAPPWTDSYTEVLNRSDSVAAVAALRASWAKYREDVRTGARTEDPYAGLAWDVEATGQQWASDYRVISVAVAPTWAPSEAYLWNRGMTDRDDLQPLLDLLADPAVPKVGQNVKYDANAILSAYGVAVRNLALDTRLVSRLVEPDTDADLDNLGWTVGCGGHKAEAAVHLDKAVKAINKNVRNAEKDSAKAVGYLFADAAPVLPSAGAGAKSIAYGMLPGEVLGRYNVRDTVTTARTAVRLSHKLRTTPHEGQRRVWDEVVGRASEVFSRVESRGFPVDRDGIYAAADVVAEKVRVAREEIRAIAPDLDPNSGEQKAKYLYETLGLKTEHKTDSGAPATDRAALTELKGEHAIIAPLIAYSELTHLRGTYLDGDPKPGEKYGTMGMLRHLRPGPGGLYYVHTTYNLDGARCMPAGELVLTARGYLVVEDVRVGDYVISHTGVPRRVDEVSTHAPTPIVRVTLSNGLSLRTTEDHAYYTAGAWTRAGDLKVGQVVSVHSDPEKWLPVVGWEGYSVSSWGRVRNEKTERIVTQYPKGRWGHLKVCLSRNGAQTRGPDRRDFPVHRLVMLAFKGAPPVGQSEVRHLNGLAWDNTLGNLAWGSRAENAADARRHGTMSQRDRGYEGTKLSEDAVAAIRATPRPPRGGAGRWDTSGAVSDATLASRYGVTRVTIRDVRAGKRWLPETHVEGSPVPFSEATVIAVQVEAPRVTYGLSVETDHSHVTGGVVTHNTGRLSSSNPNLQNIPRAEDELGKLIKDLFVAPPGWSWLQLDYSQLELRVAAILSQDPVMFEIFNSGIDYHLRTAELIAPVFGHTGEAWKALSKEAKKALRSYSKTVNFGLLYGMGVKTLASRMGCDLATAERTMKAVLGKLRRLSSWIDKRKWEADTTGVVWTEWRGLPGRARPIHTLQFKGTVAVNCLDHETEALTRRGWVRGFDLLREDVLLTKNADTGALEWQAMDDLRLFPDYRGEVVEFRSRSFSAVSTPDHRWLVRDKASGRDVCKTTATLSPHGDHRVHRTGVYAGPAQTQSDDFVELAGWYLTDGFSRRSWVPKGTRRRRHVPPVRRVGLCQSNRANPHKVARIDALLGRLGIEGVHRAGPRTRTEMVYWSFKGDVAACLRETFPQRLLTPEFLSTLTRTQAHLLLDTMMAGDGHTEVGGKRTFVSRSEVGAGLFQVLATLAGVASTVKRRDGSRYTPRSPKLLNIPRGGVYYVVTLLSRGYAQVVASQRHTRLATHGVWCPVVPNTYFVARRDGKVMVTGNTPVQGTASEFCLASVCEAEEAIANEGLSEHAYLVGTVHDSILGLVRDEYVPEVSGLVANIMEGWLPDAPIRLQVDGDAGQKWGSLHEIVIPR